MRRLILLFMMVTVVFLCIGATNYTLRFDGPLDSVIILKYEDHSATPTDSSTVGDDVGETFPYDTTISLDETKHNRFLIGYFYDYVIYGLWADGDVFLDENLTAHIALMRNELGLPIGATSTFGRATDRDTLYIYDSTGALIRRGIYIHISDTAGGVPDSTRTTGP